MSTPEAIARLQIDAALEAAGWLVQDRAADLKCAGWTRRAILRRAFEGKLVPQDPDDEPASALLQRIRAESSSSRSTKAKKVPASHRRNST